MFLVVTATTASTSSSSSSVSKQPKRFLMMKLKKKKTSSSTLNSTADSSTTTATQPQEEPQPQPPQHLILHFGMDFGGIPDDNSPTACQFNTDLLSQVLQYNATNNTIVIAKQNETYHFYSGIYASNIYNTVLIIDGTMRFERRDDTDDHHDSNHDNNLDDDGKVVAMSAEERMNLMYDKTSNDTLAQRQRRRRKPHPCWMMDESRNITLKSTASSNDPQQQQRRGLIDGRGSQYWGVPGIGYLQLAEHRPRMIQINLTYEITIENLIFQDSPYHTIYLESVENVHIHHVSIVARRTDHDGHSWIDLTAFNTDGIDVSGTNVHIHDVDIWTQDDCIAVKDNIFPPYESTNMLMERVNCSGLGFVVGSIGGTTVRNITFRNSYLHRSVKGIYMKFRPPGSFWQHRNLSGRIENVVFENITMQQPLQWPIWIGPAQQSDARRPCAAHPCSLCWPQNPMAQCHAVPQSQYHNITLRNVQIYNPLMSPGVLMGATNDNAPITNLLFDNVRVITQEPPAQYDRMESFPGLLQPIVDHYVPNTIQRQFMESALTARIPDTAIGNTLLLPDSIQQQDDTTVVDHHEDHWYYDGANDDTHCLVVTLFVIWHVLLVMLWRRRTWRQSSSAQHYNNNYMMSYDPLDEAAMMSYPAKTTNGDDDEIDEQEEVGVEEEEDGIVKPNNPVPISTRRRQRYSSWNVACRIIVPILVVEILLLTALLYSNNVTHIVQSWSTPKWNRLNQYYRCEGIINGRATGGTWPIPPCFVEENLSA